MRVISVVAIVLALTVVASPARAQSLVLSSETSYVTVPFVYETLPTYTVYIVANNNFDGLTGVQFAAPLPDCMANATLVSENSDFLFIGSIETGVQVAFGGCLTGDIEVMRLTFVSTGIDTCCVWEIVPDPAAPSGEVIGIDCSSSEVSLWTFPATVVPEGFQGCGSPTVPSNPSPPDGATNQPLNVTLNWDSEPTAGTGLGVFFSVVYLGTEPDPPLLTTMVDPPYDVGPLDPSTTYYWKIVSVVTDYGSTEGPVWQFTTQTGPSPVERTTWGAIKTLYRE